MREPFLQHVPRLAKMAPTGDPIGQPKNLFEMATLEHEEIVIVHSHQIDLTSVEIVDRSSAWRQRLILEAWHSMRNTNAINEHIALPNVYNNITNL